MKAVTTLALVFLVLASASDAGQKWPLIIDADASWQIEYQGDGIDFFALTRPRGENVFFTFSRWPAPGGREQIPSLLGRVADRYAQQGITESIPSLGKDRYRLEEIVGDSFSGEAAIFTNWDRSLLALFMVSDGDGIWQGQYSGSSTTWEKAKVVLMNLRRVED